MPRTIQELKSFIPKSKFNAQPDRDPSKNDLLQNMKLLSQELDKTGFNEIGKLEKDSLKAGIDSFTKALTGNAETEALYKPEDLKRAFEGMSLNCLNPNSPNRIANEEQRNRIADLIGYVTAGLGIESEDITIAPDKLAAYKKHALDMAKKGAEAVRREQPPQKKEPEPKEQPYAFIPQRYDNLPANAYNALEGLKGVIRSFKSDKRSEEVRKQEAIKVSRRILAVRRSIGAERNNKQYLKDHDCEPEVRNAWTAKMEKCKTFTDFLGSMTLDGIVSLAGDGHGGALEYEFKKHVYEHVIIPSDVPLEYMPTAKNHIEYVQDLIDSSAFKKYPPEKKAMVYAELIASRAAVNSVRNDGSTLDRPLNAGKLAAERRKLMSEPMKSALIKLASREDGKDAIKAAGKGHGGLLEDKLKEELREMGKRKEYNYSLPCHEKRWAPTYEQRRGDIAEIMDDDIQNELTKEQRLQRAIEYNRLGSGRTGDKLKETMTDSATETKAANILGKAFYKIGSAKETNDIVSAFSQKNESLLNSRIRKFSVDHRGEIAAVGRQIAINEKYASVNDPDKLRRLIAESTLINRELEQFKTNKDQDSINCGKERAELEKRIDELVKTEDFQKKYGDKSPAELKLAIEELSQKCDNTVSEIRQGPNVQQPINAMQLGAV